MRQPLTSAERAELRARLNLASGLRNDCNDSIAALTDSGDVTAISGEAELLRLYVIEQLRALERLSLQAQKACYLGLDA